MEKLLAQLEDCKRRFGPGEQERTLRLIRALEKRRFPDAASLIRFHETLLFLRAYPASAEILKLADQILLRFGERVARLTSDLSPFEEPEVSGIAGTSFTAIFSHGVARHLAERHGTEVRIDWDCYEKPERMAPAAARLFPLFREDWPVEANVPYRDWLRAARSRSSGDLAWLIARLREQPELYDSLELPVLWELGESRVTRSKMRLPAPKVFYHRAPLLRRADISLAGELASPPLPIVELSPREGEAMLNLARDTSAVRYRELYGFTYSDPKRVRMADAGRGLQIFVFGLPPERRLPLRAYHSAIFIKNGVPAGYVEVLSLFERMEVGFNIYYTFREGESAWLYARTLHLFRQLCGVNCFSVDPYQIGFHNKEGIDSGAFWFYRKLGFRPVDSGLEKLAITEERRVQATPGYRTPARTLRRLSESYLIFESPGVTRGDWDRFRIRNLAFAVQRRMAEQCNGDAAKMRGKSAANACRALGIRLESRILEDFACVLGLIPDLANWAPAEKDGIIRIIRAKAGADEAQYLRLMQRHRRLRDALLKLGSKGL
jgi:hypothetical protein